MTTGVSLPPRKESSVFLRLTNDEKERFSDAAWEARTNLSDWIRKACEAAIDLEKQGGLNDVS